MTTPQQRDANRANARSSTGPRTDAGRWRSAQNAFRHGLYAQTDAAIPRGPFAEDPDTLEAQRAAIVTSLRPRDAIEERQARVVAALYVKLERLDRFETYGIDRDSDHPVLSDLAQRAEAADLEAARAQNLYEALEDGTDDWDWAGFATDLLDMVNGGVPVDIENLWTSERTPQTEQEWRAVVHVLLGRFYPDADTAAATISARAWRYAQEAADLHAQCLALGAHRVLNGTLPKTVPLAARLARQLDQTLHTYQSLTERDLRSCTAENGRDTPVSRNEPNLRPTGVVRDSSV